MERFPACSSPVVVNISLTFCSSVFPSSGSLICAYFSQLCSLINVMNLSVGEEIVANHFWVLMESFSLLKISL